MIKETWKELRARGVLGLNDRNLHYVSKYNERRLYPLVDDKYRTKKLARAAGVAVPELYGMVEILRQARDLPAVVQDKAGFAIKPSQGSGGSGVLVLTERTKNGWRKSSGDILTWEDLQYHISLILSGIFSLGGQPDKALVEYRVVPDKVFNQISYLGVPDMRIIVFFGVPVMTMVRLPTRISGGRANLHQGAIGVGIDIATGQTQTGVCQNEIITEHPDTGYSIMGIEIPHWEEMLALAAKSYELTGLAYQGVDIVLDRTHGPLLLELNARPGLNIQIANNCGLLPRLKKVEWNRKKFRTPEDRVKFAKDEFGVQSTLNEAWRRYKRSTFFGRVK